MTPSSACSLHEHRVWPTVGPEQTRWVREYVSAHAASLLPCEMINPWLFCKAAPGSPPWPVPALLPQQPFYNLSFTLFHLLILGYKYLYVTYLLIHLLFLWPKGPMSAIPYGWTHKKTRNTWWLYMRQTSVESWICHLPPALVKLLSFLWPSFLVCKMEIIRAILSEWWYEDWMRWCLLTYRTQGLAHIRNVSYKKSISKCLLKAHEVQGIVLVAGGAKMVKPKAVLPLWSSRPLEVG